MNLYIKALRVLNAMIDRCYRENATGYHRYGGRGIYIDDRWLKDPTAFVEWYVKNYFDGCQVDRINNDGPYSSDNCRMSTPKENVRNRSITKKITAWGETKTIMEWLEDPRCNAGSHSVLHKRTSGKVAGEWTPEDSISRENGYKVITKRLRDGWNAEEALELLPDSKESVKRKDRNKNGNIRGQMPNVEKLTAFGESKTLHEWSIDPRCVVDKNTLWYRKSKGWDMEKAITTPPAKNAGQLYEGKSVLQWSKDSRCQVSYKVLNSRLKKGVPLATALKA